MGRKGEPPAEPNKGGVLPTMPADRRGGGGSDKAGGAPAADDDAALSSGDDPRRLPNGGTEGASVKPRPSAADESEEFEEIWELVKIYSTREITEHPIQCETKDCNLLAAVVRESNTNPWRGCLDCQVSRVILQAIL